MCICVFQGLWTPNPLVTLLASDSLPFSLCTFLPCTRWSVTCGKLLLCAYGFTSCFQDKHVQGPTPLALISISPLRIGGGEWERKVNWESGIFHVNAGQSRQNVLSSAWELSARYTLELGQRENVGLPEKMTLPQNFPCDCPSSLD